MNDVQKAEMLEAEMELDPNIREYYEALFSAGVVSNVHEFLSELREHFRRTHSSPILTDTESCVPAEAWTRRGATWG
jgi:hypothetical protein